MKLHVLLGFVVATLTAWDFVPQDHFDAPPALATRHGSAIRPHEFAPLFMDAKPLANLARDGVYTVVEVYINTCSTCKQLEAELPAFVAHRQDVVVRRVHFPEDGLSFSSDDSKAIAARIDSYHICGTPHVEIYGPDREPLHRDNCGAKDGLNYLRAWIAAEQTRA